MSRHETWTCLPLGYEQNAIWIQVGLERTLLCLPWQKYVFFPILYSTKSCLGNAQGSRKSTIIDFSEIDIQLKSTRPPNIHLYTCPEAPLHIRDKFVVERQESIYDS